MKFEYFDVGDRPVVMDRVKDEAWIWSAGEWRNDPGLLQSHLPPGERITREQMVAQYPFAALELLELPAG